MQINSFTEIKGILMSIFYLKSENTPTGDQPEAIASIVENINLGVKNQVLLGATGTGKTFTMANVIARCGKPSLILAHNKTLAAQLYGEFKALFPENAVEYFVSYYDYFQPEAYVPSSDTYIEKDSAINDNIDKLRHAATHSLLTRKDVIIIASVSCIYGLGSPEYYAKLMIPIEVGQKEGMDSIITKMIDVQYTRNDMDFHRGTFRVRGDVLEVIPVYEHEKALRLEFFGDEIEAISEIDPLTGNVLAQMKKRIIYPASHYVSDRENIVRAMGDIRKELQVSLAQFQGEGKLVEAQRLEQKTQLDLEMMQELGYCNGIENYSRHLDNRVEGEAPSTLLDYFPEDFLIFIDESHQTMPQIGAMYKGDRSRKQTLVNYGFRLPSALDNRPLMFEEYQKRVHQSVYVSATPGKWELEESQGLVSEQIIRPTGLVDPIIEIRPTKGQMEDLISECRTHAARHERVLITTLTKRMAEELSVYFKQMNVSAKYLHSDIDTLERVAIIKSLRMGEFDVLIGINLLREGLDIPEVSLVAILDADKEGFLRSTSSLIQTFGRAARNEHGKVILYADKMTNSMQTAIDETVRRRTKQVAYNEKHNITPTTIIKPIDHSLDNLYTPIQGKGKGKKARQQEIVIEQPKNPKELAKLIEQLEKQMRAYAKDLNFEQAAQLRDKIVQLRELFLAE